MRIHTAAEFREIDRRAQEDVGLPTALLMENAGRAVADAAKQALRARGRIFIVCGKGNNGGDGWCAARHLFADGLPSVVVSMDAIETMSPDARLNALAATRLGVPVVSKLPPVGPADVVVDAVLGTGLTRSAEGNARVLIEAIRAAREAEATIVSVDLPSGLDADRGHPIGPHVVANRTISLHALKIALTQYPARSFAGDVRVAPIGLPAVDGPGARRTWMTKELLRSQLPKRAADAHKGTNGHLLLVAGSPGKSGAALLAARGALRAGAGLVTVASSSGVLESLATALPEAMGALLERLEAESLLRLLDRKAALVAGPGLGVAPSLGRVLAELLGHVSIPSVLDADALNAIAADPDAKEALAHARVSPVLTPHPAELARLLDTTTEAIQRDRFAAATQAASMFRAHVVLKGAATVIAHPDGSLDVNSSGTAALAVGGTGDVLAGAIGGLLSQGLAPGAAARLGVHLHGLAGERAARGLRGLLASEVADELPAAFVELEGG